MRLLKFWENFQTTATCTEHATSYLDASFPKKRPNWTSLGPQKWKSACGRMHVCREKSPKHTHAAAYTPGVLGVRRTPCQAEHDVTFSIQCDQGKITKKLER